MAVVTIPFSELDTWLQSQPANTTITPYELNITGLTAEDLSYSNVTGTLGAVLRNNPTKYVNLSETIIPSITSLYSSFEGCSSLVIAPNIPNTVVNMYRAFYGCVNLVSAPVLPNSVIDLAFAFFACIALTIAPNIPNQVTSISYMFESCTSLVTVPEIPASVTRMEGAFKGCSSLIIPPNIPPLVTAIENIFENCSSLTTAPNIPPSVINMSYSFKGCSSLTSAPVIPASVKWLGSAFYGCSSLVSPPEIPNSVLSLSSTFRDCSSLTTAPNIPNSVTNIENCFVNCTSLTTTPNIPDTISSMASAFYNCTSLTTFTQKKFNPDNINTYSLVFYGCTRLTNFISDSPSVLKNWLTTIHNESSYNFPNNPNNCVFSFPTNSVIEIPIANLNEDLALVSGSSVSSPYNIKVVDLTANDLGDSATSGTLGYVLNQNSTKYVDLSETVLPNATDLTSTFENCATLVDSPALPNTVTVLDSTYKGCSNITKITEVPSGVTDLTETFKNCTSLEEIEQFDVPLSVLKTNAQDCFDGCTSLTTVGVQGVAPITESSEWHAMKLNFGNDNVSGKVYDKDKNTTTIPQTTIQKGTLKLPVKTDELWFPPSNMSDADVDEVIESVIDTKRTYFNKDVLNPLNKSFVLWKDSQSQFVSNIDFGGSGSGITVYDTEEEMEEDLPNKQDGDLVGTLSADEGELQDAPLGSVMSYLGNTDPSDGKWLICDGRDTTGTAIELETHYPSLYMFLGGTNVLPEIFDHNRPSNAETITLSQTSSSPTVMQYDGELNLVGNFTQNIIVYVNGVVWGRYRGYHSTSYGTITVPFKKGDNIYYTSDTTAASNQEVVYYKHHNIIKAVSSVDYYHAPSSEIAQIESYVDTGLGNFLTQLNTWVDVSSDFSVVDSVAWANTPTSSLKVLYNAYQKKLKVWSWYNSTKSASSTHAFTLQYNGNNTDIVFDPTTTIAMQTLNKSYLGYDTTTNPDSAPNSNGFECSYNIRTSKQIRLGGYNRNGSTAWGANICLVAEISL